MSMLPPTVAFVPLVPTTVEVDPGTPVPTNAPRDNTTVPLKTDKGTTADLTRSLEVKTIKIVSPNCL
ncbi:MAG: hypothetical protein DMF87_05610 [Acidobacteria bacterium]|nr:MAG: hypothetical protein DMF87_05610 [Acidobacteriota bacterium]